MKTLILFLFFCGTGLSLFAQETDTVSVAVVDTTFVEADTTAYENYDDEGSDEDEVLVAPPDSTDVAERPFDSGKVDELKSDPGLQYKEAPTIAESLWDRFLVWLNQIIEAIFDNAVNTNWGRVLAYLVGIALLVVVIMMILKVDAFKIFYAGQGASTIKYNVLDENIHEMDFENLIQEAISKNDYRTGVRLVFLYSLKILSDKQLIHWEQGKTNHDYVAELKSPELKTGFNELSFYFEYAWYGNFSINHDLFSKVQHTFTTWKAQLK